ncbi:hypothetical protein PanWU01x14_211850 [Parasponia andersonii]|uniref:Transposase, Ptta/En/Spm, plant n=1 Tax=Parasponia andersonii TaxID=3476 RepID=A0A2P5BTH8_PARAD|nr:hypothetical protein PanWU01x14_211850 [Parasponia andersonii]
MGVPSKEETKRKRGKTKMSGVSLNEAITVEFNLKGQPIGAESIRRSSFLGPLVREIVLVTFTDWRKVAPEIKEVLWKSIQVRYKLDRSWKKDYVFKTMGALWRASKSRLVKDIKEAKNDEERMKLKPDNIKSIIEWKAFVREKTSIVFQVHHLFLI